MSILRKQDVIQGKINNNKSYCKVKMAEKKETQNSQEKIAQLQLLEQNMQTFTMQKQQFQMQLNEILSALENIKDAKKSYKIIANVMIDTN